MTLLQAGNKFPTLTITLPGGDSIQLPDALNGHYGVVLFYRGFVVSLLQRPAQDENVPGPPGRAGQGQLAGPRC